MAPHTLKRSRTLASTLIMTAALSGVPPGKVAAQARREVQQSPQVDDRAQDTRRRLRDLLDRYPPTLAQVFRLDPSLMTNQAYLAPYPTLAAFLGQHAEVAHNPAYFVGEVHDVPFGGNSNPEFQKVRAMQESAVGFALFVFFMAALTVLAYIGRAVIEHRRWLHMTKVQTEAHTKLVDRLGSNEELMAYIQSPAGQRFLAAAPIASDLQSQPLGAPIGRILGSLQVGVVITCAGIGLWVANNKLTDLVVQPLFYVMATVAIALGVGFVISGLVSYGFSRWLGLIHSTSAPHA